MWLVGEIVQGDSGQTVSNKLDAEFTRIQTQEVSVEEKLDTLEYADDVTIFDRTKTELLVSPYLFWLGLDATIVKVDQSKTITDHFSNQLFDGIPWMRVDVNMEYNGSFIPLADLGNGFYLTKAHYTEFYQNLEETFLKQDGSTMLTTGYYPEEGLSVASKAYVDDREAAIIGTTKTSYIEYPASQAGDTSFGAALLNYNFVVYLNGVLQRRIKYSYNISGIVFTEPLAESDEVTIVILGE